MEVFAKPCAGAIIERLVDGVPCILIQTRQKPGGDNIRWMPVDTLRILLENHPEDFFFMHLCALRKYLNIL